MNLTRPGSYTMIGGFRLMQRLLNQQSLTLVNCCVKSQVQGGTNIESICCHSSINCQNLGLIRCWSIQRSLTVSTWTDCLPIQNTTSLGPAGWVVCDGRTFVVDVMMRPYSNYLIKLGANNTTLSGCDLRGRFIRGYMKV